MLSNFGNLLLLINIFLSFTIIYSALRCLKIPGKFIPKIIYRGTVPNLFSEEKGVVAEGKLEDKTFFIADRILAKHDENYMPPELKNIMK